jgi:hypothetical protein
MGQAKSIDDQIIGYLNQLSDKKKKAVLTVVKTFAEETPSLWDIMPEEVQKGLVKSISQSKKGIGKSQSDILAKYNKWLKK